MTITLGGQGGEMENPMEGMVRRYPDLAPIRQDVASAFARMRDSFARGGKLLICGNGGSAADAEHIAGELLKGFLSDRPLPAQARQRLIEAYPPNGEYLADHLQGALPAISLAGPLSFLTAYANDVAPDMVFAQGVYAHGRAGDILLGLSTSGNSRNVIHAMQVARALGLGTIGFTGAAGGALREFCDVAVCIPSQITSEIQERHQAVYHVLCALLEAEFFKPEAN